MKIRTIFFLALPWLILASAPPAPAEEAMTKDRLIGQARARLGAEEILQKVDSLRYSGTIEDEVKGAEGSLVMILKKPLCQRLEITMNDVHEITAVNGYEGWVQRIDRKTGESGVRIMNFANVERMLNNTWENLNFFAEPKERFGKVRYGGRVEHRGRPAYRLETEYPGGSKFIRFFDTRSSELIATVTENNLEIVESGMIEAGGIKFPRKIEAFRDGRKIHTIRFEEIVVNPDVSDELFDFPAKRVTIKP